MATGQLKLLNLELKLMLWKLRVNQRLVKEEDDNQLHIGSTIPNSRNSPSTNSTINESEVINSLLTENLNSQIDDDSDEFMAELDELRQISSVKVYYDEFVRVTNRMQLPDDDYKVYRFVFGLNEEIRCYVNMFDPMNLDNAYSLATFREFSLYTQENNSSAKIETVECKEIEEFVKDSDAYKMFDEMSKTNDEEVNSNLVELKNMEENLGPSSKDSDENGVNEETKVLLPLLHEGKEEHEKKEEIVESKPLVELLISNQPFSVSDLDLNVNYVTGHVNVIRGLALDLDTSNLLKKVNLQLSNGGGCLNKSYPQYKFLKCTYKVFVECPEPKCEPKWAGKLEYTNFYGVGWIPPKPPVYPTWCGELYGIYVLETLQAQVLDHSYLATVNTMYLYCKGHDTSDQYVYLIGCTYKFSELVFRKLEADWDDQNTTKSIMDLGVAGAVQAKLELREVVEFLETPDKYTTLVAKIPKGCLLVGPSRKDVRKRTNNHLLSKMGGFSSNSGVIVDINGADVLDSALLRPRRFDRHVIVDRPDVIGRVRILQFHSSDKDMVFYKIARRTLGYTGAGLGNLMNEVDILFGRREFKEISKDEIPDTLERITELGVEGFTNYKGNLCFLIGSCYLYENLWVLQIDILCHGIRLGSYISLPIRFWNLTNETHLNFLAHTNKWDVVLMFLGVIWSVFWYQKWYKQKYCILNQNEPSVLRGMKTEVKKKYEETKDIPMIKSKKGRDQVLEKIGKWAYNINEHVFIAGSFSYQVEAFTNQVADLQMLVYDFSCKILCRAVAVNWRLFGTDESGFDNKFTYHRGNWIKEW